MSEHPLASAEEIARAMRTARLKATGAAPMMILYSDGAPAEDADLASARAVLDLVEPAFAAQAAEVTRLREEYEALSYIAGAAMAERDKLRGDLDQLRAVYAAQVERTVAAEAALAGARASG